uniref:Uncharacterized protein n=2 Tax=Musca domestica TaxID=7370 RepID=A0A1I8N9S4_MUSDO
MAPFKLKFRMGSSRSTSQEHEPDPQVNEALLNHQTSGAIGASSSTIDSVDCNSLVSLNTSERKLLLPNKGNSLRMGFINQNQGENIPTTPPPTYEHVLEEQRQLAIAGINISINNDEDDDDDEHNRHLNELEQLSLNELPCTDPNCQENYTNNNHHNIKPHNNNNEAVAAATASSSVIASTTNSNTIDPLGNNDHLHQNITTAEDPDNNLEDDRKESIDSQELLLGDNMTDSSSDQDRDQMVGENSCSGNCQQCPDGSTCQQYSDGSACQQYSDGSASCSGGGGDVNSGGDQNQSNDFYDPLMNHGIYCNDASHYDEDYQSHQQMYDNDGNSGECDESCTSEHHWDMNPQSSSHQSLHCDSSEQQQQQQQQQYYQQQLERSLTPEIISNKSSKEIYKDLAKQCGITCKMSDGCRCMECQSHYFDCEYDD